MKKLVALAALLLSAACTTGRLVLPDPFAKFHDQTGLVNGQVLNLDYARRVHRAGHIRGLMAYLSCEIAEKEGVIRNAEQNLSDYRLLRARQNYWRYSAGDDYYISNKVRQIASASEKLAVMRQNAAALRLRVDLPCAGENLALAQAFLENHTNRMYD